MSAITVRPGRDMDGAVQRTTKTIILMVDAALGQLKDLGYERGFDDVEIVDADGFPFITLDGEPVFEVRFDADPNRGLAIKGEWLFQPPRRRFMLIRRMYRWVIRKLINA